MLTHLHASRGMLAAILLVACQANANRLIGAVHKSPVDVQIRDSVEVPDALVTLADIAHISGGDPALRHLIGKLDVAEIEAAPGREIVKKSQIELRLRLSGIEPSSYSLSGPSETSISRVHKHVNDETVIEALRTPLAKLWKVDAANLELRLARPLSSFAKSLPTNVEGRLEPFIRDSMVPGRLRVSIGMYDKEDLVKTFAVSIDASIRRRVAVANTRLRPGQVITTEDIEIEERNLTGRGALDIADSVLNRVAARWVGAGQSIREQDIYAQGRHDLTRAQKVKRNSLVQLVARKKGLRVTVPNGILLREAHVGETVQVRNPTSDRTVVGRLISPSEVEVEVSF